MMTDDQRLALSHLDDALCNFLNSVGDPWKVDKWRKEVGRNFESLAKAYNEAHRTGLMPVDEANGAIEAAAADVARRGEGWLMVDPDGNVRHVGIDEARKRP